MVPKYTLSLCARAGLIALHIVPVPNVDHMHVVQYLCIYNGFPVCPNKLRLD